MTESVARRGHDTWVGSAHPNAEHGDTNAVQLKSGEKRALLFMPMPTGLAGRQVGSAVLSGHAAEAVSAQTLTFAPLNEKWAAAWANWNKQPAIRAGSVTAAIGALAQGGEFTVDVTSQIQSVADGSPHWGWRISTSAGTTQKFYSFDSAQDSWTLTIVFSDNPDEPTGLKPDGGVVANGKPFLSYEYDEVGGVSTELAAHAIQVSATANPASLQLDTGWLSTTVARFDLGASAYAGLGAGATTSWRVRVRNEDGAESAWSDWADFTYRALPVLTLDSPAAGVLYDPTSEVLAHIAGTNLDTYRVIITSGTDRSNILYDSGNQPAGGPSNIALELPEFNEYGTRIFKDDRDYQLNVQAHDTYNRQAGGYATYAEVWSTIHFDDDLALTPIASLNAWQVSDLAAVQLTWTRAAAADKWQVEDNGVLVAVLEPADTVIGVSTYTWIHKNPQPNTLHTYTVRAVTTGVGRSVAGPSDTIVPLVEGLWLVRDDHSAVRLDGDGVNGFRTLERRASFNPVNLPYSVDIITGFEGVSGTFEGVIDEEIDQSIADAVVVLDAIKVNPSEPVRLIYGDVSVPILVKNLTCLPDGSMRPEADRRHFVVFDLQQVGEFKHGSS